MNKVHDWQTFLRQTIIVLLYLCFSIMQKEFGLFRSSILMFSCKNLVKAVSWVKAVKKFKQKSEIFNCHSCTTEN